MKLWLSLLMGLKEIAAHKFRSILTMLGIILGVASLLTTFALTAGIAHGMRDFMAQIGGIEKIEVSKQDPPESQINLADISPGSTLADAEIIQARASLVNYISPVSTVTNAALTRGNQTFRASVYGCWPDYFHINKHELLAGRILSQIDLDEARHVCLVGQSITENLWPGKPPTEALGQSFLINGRPFTIVGIFQQYERASEKSRRANGLPPARPSPSRSKNWDPFFFKNTSVQAPISTIFYDFKSANVVNKVDLGPNYKLDQLIFQINDASRFQEAVEESRALLNLTHRGIQDFSFITREEWFDNMERSIKSTKISGGLIACISLIVGGIGITNIMLASVTERIREIGVRLAIGAKGRDIFLQIIVESSVIGLGGGILGLGASFGLLRLLAKITEGENTPIVEPAAILISVTFAIGIGVVSGFYPALKASRMDPIEALRYG